jgi:hypothetical protein
MTSILIFWSLSLALLVIGVLALWKGGPAERLGAGLILAIVLLGRIVALFVPPSGHAVLHLVEDGLTALGLLAVAIRYASLWLGGAMLVYAVLFTLHSAYFVLSRAQDPLFIFVNNAAFLCVALCLAVGTALSWRARIKAQAASKA